MDPQPGSEMAGEESVGKKMEDLERELSEERSSHHAEKQRAKAAEQAMRALTADVEKLSLENRVLQNELNTTQMVKKDEARETKPADLDGVMDQKMDVDNESSKVEEITSLRKELEDLRAEQRTHQEAEASWLKIRMELRQQLVDVMVQKSFLSLQLQERSRTRLQGEEAEDDSDDQSEDGETSEEEEEEEEELEATPAIRNYISDFSLFGGFPQNRLTSPVALKAGSVVPDLASHVGYGKFLYIPAGHIRWYSEKTHAITCGPSFILHQNRWEERSLLSKFFDTTQEVFFARGRSVYYAGRYRCHPPPDFLPQTIALPGDMSMRAMTDALRVPDSFQETWADEQTLQKLFRHGILKVEYLILECVGFSHKLHRRMLEQYDGMDTAASGSSKRKRGPQTNPKKKRKV